jgi:hypothetical protein
MWKVDSIGKDSLTFRLVEDHLQVTINAPIPVVIEAAGLLCWLGAVCRASDSPDSRSYCTPVIRKTTVESEVQTYTISYPQRPHDEVEDEEDSTPKSWQLLGRNPCIARGFPIPRRDQQQKGVEVPFTLMADLGCANSLNIYDDQLILKGISSMYVPVESGSSSLTWHFFPGVKKQRISWNKAFEKALFPRRTHVPTLDIKDWRHFVD